MMPPAVRIGCGLFWGVATFIALILVLIADPYRYALLAEHQREALTGMAMTIAFAVAILLITAP